MKSKIVQIQAVPMQYRQSEYPQAMKHYARIYALCEDGTIWSRDSHWDDEIPWKSISIQKH